MTEIEDQAVQILSNEGAQCGNCGDQPGDRNCPDCEKCRRGYVAALVAAGWGPQAQPAGRDLRNRIAQAIRGLNEGGTLADLDEEPDVLAIADAVLAVLPAPADRAAVLREAAHAIAALPKHRDSGTGLTDAADALRRMADEAQQAGEGR